jgi:hypothetical protein
MVCRRTSIWRDLWPCLRTQVEIDKLLFLLVLL